VGIWDDLTVNGAIHMTGSQGELGLRVIATEYASGGNTGAEAYKMSGAGTPECVRGRMYLGRPSGAGSQDGLCVCMNVDGSLDWWCFNP
jgi:hypothetical protein